MRLESPGKASFSQLILKYDACRSNGSIQFVYSLNVPALVWDILGKRER